MKVHILVNHFNGESEEVATLVLKTIRVGFPTFEIVVWNNSSLTLHNQECRHSQFQTHYDWINMLLKTSQSPFVICDTDVIFYESMELDFMENANETMFGRLIPTFIDHISQAVSLSRLHPSLLLLNPVAIEKLVAIEREKSWSSSISLLLTEAFYFNSGEHRVFSDCMASLSSLCKYKKPFTYHQLNKYFHLFCGTYAVKHSDKLNIGLKDVHLAVCNNPELGRGAWREQEIYFNL